MIMSRATGRYPGRHAALRCFGAVHASMSVLCSHPEAANRGRGLLHDQVTGWFRLPEWQVWS